MQCRICSGTSNPVILFKTKYIQHDDFFNVAKCPDCFVRFVLNPPADLSPFYQNTPMRMRRNFIYSALKKILLDSEINKIVGFLPDAKIFIDVGCGGGELSLLLYQKGFRVVAVDSSQQRPYAVEHNKEISYAVIDYSNGNIEGIAPMQQGIVILRHVLEHVPYPVQFIQKLSEYGVDYFYIVVPNHAHPLDAFFGQYYAHYDVPRHLTFFDASSLEKTCLQAGYEIIRKGSSTIPITIASLYRYICIKKENTDGLVSLLKPDGLISTLSLPLDLLIPNNVIWVLIGKKNNV